MAAFTEEDKPIGEQNFDILSAIQHFKEISVGAGSTIFKANSEGVFAGATNFTDAPWKVDYNGLMTFSMGSGNITIDAVNKRILVNDGTNNRVLIGYGQGLF